MGAGRPVEISEARVFVGILGAVGERPRYYEVREGDQGFECPAQGISGRRGS